MTPERSRANENGWLRGRSVAESHADPDQSRMAPTFQAKMYRPSGETRGTPGSCPTETAKPAFQEAGRRPLVVSGRETGSGCRLVVEKPLQLLEFAFEVRIFRNFTLDFADCVQHRSVVAATEAPADLR